MKKIHNFYFPDWDTHFQDFFNTNIGYQEAQRNRALAHVNQFGIAVDCGAHIGLWSRDLENYFDKLYCFEPVKEFFNCLKINIKNKNTELYNQALGNEMSSGEILITKNSGNSGLTHVMNNNKKNFNEKDIIEKIEIVKLDSFNLKQLDFFKIDVEGLGLDVLRGAKKTLENCNPIVCLELFELVDKKEQIKFMNDLGYEIKDIIIKEHVFKKM